MAEHDRGPSLILRLPGEITLKIFSHLDISDLLKVSLSCLQWRKLARDSSLWTTPRIGPKLKDPKLVLGVFKAMDCLKFIVSLSLCCPTTLPVDDLLQAVKNRSRKLRQLKLFGQTLRNLNILGKVIRDFPKLEDLALENTQERSPSACILPVRDTKRHMRSLHIASSSYHMTVSLVEQFLQVESLEFLSVEINFIVVSHLWRLIKKHANSLQQLHVRGSVIDFFFRIVRDRVPSNIVTLYIASTFLIIFSSCRVDHFPAGNCFPFPFSGAYRNSEGTFQNMKRLEFTNIITLEDDFLETIANDCSELRELFILCCPHVTYKGFHHILLKCTNLSTLKYGGMENITVSNLCEFITLHNLPFGEIVISETPTIRTVTFSRLGPNTD